MFPTSSRYHSTKIARLVTNNGREVVYLQRRFLPPAEQFAIIAEHTVAQEDRLDNVTAKYLGDPLLFWQVCDANNAMRPEELMEEIGRRLRIAMPMAIGG